MEQSPLNMFLAQLPAILTAFALVIGAVGAAWNNLSKKIEAGNKVAESTHILMNSQLAEWKKEIREASAAAVLAAHKDGITTGRAELRAEQAKVAEGNLAGRAEVKAEEAARPKGELS